MAKVDYKDIARSVADQMTDKASSDIAESLAAYLVGERRVNELDKIMREVARIRLVDDGILEIDITTAHGVTAEIENQVRGLFSAKNITINKQIDASLVGGVKVQAQDTLIDLSVRGQLNTLKAHKF